MAIEAKRHSTSSTKRLLIGCGALLVGIICVFFFVAQNYIRSLFITIGPEEVGVVISPYEPTGYIEGPLTPGNRMIRPFEQVEIYKVSKETYSSSSDFNCCSDGSGAVSVYAKDDKAITVNYQVIFAIDPNQVVQIHHNWLHRYKDNFVKPQSKLAVEKIASEYTSDEIALTKKDEIEQSIFANLELVFSEEGLILLDFKLEDVRLKD